MSSRDIDRRWRGTPFYFANDHGSIEQDRREGERRRSRRWRVHLWAEQQGPKVDGVEVVHVPELSSEGAFVVRSPALDLGDIVELLFTLPGQLQPISPKGRVASMRLTPDNPAAPCGYGVFFTQLSDAHREQLGLFLEELAERELSRPRPVPAP